jgi:hypothetical protein
VTTLRGHRFSLDRPAPAPGERTGEDEDEDEDEVPSEGRKVLSGDAGG